jgi:Pvc16 N-terminal domain
MSSPLAIAAVSAVLRNLLDDGLVDVGAAVGAVKVTAVAPDTPALVDPNAGPGLNLFLHRVSPNQGWRNVALPSHTASGSRQTNPPLGLDLHYLLTAYGTSDFQAEILLGYAMSLLHERPVLDRASIRTALDPSPRGPSILPPAFQALAASDLADQLESVTVTWTPMDTEEMTRLWSAIQTHYRPTVAYAVSVVLIESTRPARSPLPVLRRAAFVQPDLGPPLPTILAVRPPGEQPAVRLGETLGIEGAHLDGSSVVVSFAHPLLDAPRTIAVGTSTDPAGFDVVLPSGPTADDQWPAGVWTATVELVRPGETVPRTTNTVALLLAPQPVLAPAPVLVRDAGTGAVTVTMEVHPKVWPSQRATLALDGDVAVADRHPGATSTLTFRFGAIPDGTTWVRLTVDGVESLLVDRSARPPAFDPGQTVTVPA